MCGLPGLLGVFGLAVVFVIGVSGRQFEEDSREWWSRLGGVLFGVAVGWLVVAGLAVYAPPWVMRVTRLAQGLSVAWLVTTIAGVRAAMSGSTGKPGSVSWRDRLAMITPYVFLAGLLVALAFGIHAALAAWHEQEHVHRRGKRLLRRHHGVAHPEGPPGAVPVQRGPRRLLLVAHRRERVRVPHVLPEPAGPVLPRRQQSAPGESSLHRLRRGRFRADEGSSPAALPSGQRRAEHHPRDPAGVAGAKGGVLRREPDLLRVRAEGRRSRGRRELPAHGAVPRRGERGATGPPDEGPEATEPPRRRDDPDPGALKLGLGTALAVSGAAASPNQGYHSSPAVAFLMTVFNVRLGWWLQNPAQLRQWRHMGPRWGILYLLSELLGMADDSSKYVYLSDGGHFENLGIYELVRRRCRFIVACDAGMDPGFEFEDLGNAIRKCQVDLGVTIDIDTRPIRPDLSTQRGLVHCAVGTIRYGRAGKQAAGGKQAADGYLLYIKPSITGSEPGDVLQYRAAHAEFPHESTSDQWFGESQFESYRKLGHHIARLVFHGAGISAPRGRAASERPGRERMFVALKERWYPSSAAVKAAFSRHADRLNTLQVALRRDDSLRFLDAQIYPEWDELMRGREAPHPPACRCRPRPGRLGPASTSASTCSS